MASRPSAKVFLVKALKFVLGAVLVASESARGDGGTPRTVQIAHGVSLLREVLDEHAERLDEDVRAQVQQVVDAGVLQPGRDVHRAIRAVARSPRMREHPMLVARLAGWGSRWRGSGR